MCRYNVQDLPCLFGGHEPGLGDQASHVDSEPLLDTEPGDDDAWRSASSEPTECTTCARGMDIKVAVAMRVTNST